MGISLRYETLKISWAPQQIAHAAASLHAWHAVLQKCSAIMYEFFDSCFDGLTLLNIS